MKSIFALVAQLVEQLICNQRIALNKLVNSISFFLKYSFGIFFLKIALKIYQSNINLMIT